MACHKIIGKITRLERVGDGYRYTVPWQLDSGEWIVDLTNEEYLRLRAENKDRFDYSNSSYSFFLLISFISLKPY